MRGASGLILLVLAGPLHARDNAGIKSLDKALAKPAAALARKLKGKVCVLDFSDLSGGGYTSEFGQKVADLLANQLVNRAKGSYVVMERRELIKILQDAVLIVGDDAQAIRNIQKQGAMDVLVSGAYSVAGPEISVDIKAVDARGGGVLASATARVMTAEGLKSMLSHRFKQFADREGEAAAEEKPKSAAMPKTDEPAADRAHAAVDVLELETGVFYEGGDGKLYPLREGMVLNSKDNYAVYFRPKTPCYVYVYQIDGSQKAFPLFPNKDFAAEANPVADGREVWVPGGKEFLFLDEHPGREELYIFATRQPTPTLEGLREAKLESIQQAIRTMGVAGKRGSESVNRVRGTQGDALELVTRKLVAQGDFFYKLSFIHQ